MCLRRMRPKLTDHCDDANDDKDLEMQEHRAPVGERVPLTTSAEERIGPSRRQVLQSGGACTGDAFAEEQAAAAGGASEAAVVKEDVPLVLVLLGCVGVGKSSTANTIIGPTAPFKAKRAAASVTRTCQAQRARVGDTEVLVMDTPGLGDASMDEAELHDEIRKGLKELVPDSAPVCLLFVFSLQSRVGEAELNMFLHLERQMFGPAMLSSSIVVWTHADMLEEGSNVADYLEEADFKMKEALARVGGGQIALSNRAPGRAAVPQPSAPSPQALELVSRALSVAARCPEAKRRAPGVSGRKAARRQRQVEAGLLSKTHLQQRVQKPDRESSCTLS